MGAEDTLYDVIEVKLSPTNERRIIAEGKSENDAEAVIRMAVWRRGVEHSFFTKEPSKAICDLKGEG